ncbi:hypothetical protein GGD56_007355 [Rhizobium mongolense]|uniref:DUF4158 domain-containing protein n=2 Tax=Rhizobium/Agrobacterium group TaxID=227290 RepID=A0ABR6J074_9HYPH|nr:hypothetical protein [Rhizobium mongolense]
MKLLAQQVEANAAQLFKTLAAQPQPADLRRHLSFASGNGHQRADGRMRKHELLSEAEREQLLGFPADRDDLARLYTFEPGDLDLIRRRREDRNRLGVALQLALFRHPDPRLNS